MHKLHAMFLLVHVVKEQLLTMLDVLASKDANTMFTVDQENPGVTVWVVR